MSDLPNPRTITIDADAAYQLLSERTVLRTDTGVSFIIGCSNRDDRMYQAWLDQGNTPEPVPPEPTRPPRATIPDDANELDERAAQLVDGLTTWLSAAKGGSTTSAQDKAQLRRLTVLALWVVRRMGL